MTFRRRANSIKSANLSNKTADPNLHQKQEKYQVKEGSYGGVLSKGLITPSSLLNSVISDEESDEDDERDNVNSANNERNTSESAATSTLSDNRRNSMLEKPTPDVPTILQLMTEDLKNWTRNTLGAA